MSFVTKLELSLEHHSLSCVAWYTGFLQDTSRDIYKKGFHHHVSVGKTTLFSPIFGEHVSILKVLRNPIVKISLAQHLILTNITP